MQLYKKYKTTILAILGFVVMSYVYLTYFHHPSEAILTSTDTTQEDTAELLTTLANLHNIKLDEGIFADLVFVSLTDFGVKIDPQNVGRRNPFAPPGR